MNVEGAEVNVDEVAVLNKYDGDLTDEQLADAEPIETLVIKNGEIVEHIVWKEVNN